MMLCFAVKSLLSAGVDAIFIDNDNTALGAIKGIVNSAMKSKVPVFCSDTDTIKTWCSCSSRSRSI